MNAVRCAAVVMGVLVLGAASQAREWCACQSARLEWLTRHGFGQSSPGAERLRYHAATGKDLRNFPPDRLVDFVSMTLKIDIPEMNTPRLSGVCRLTFTPLGTPLGTLRLNAEQMEIEEGAVRLVEGGDGARVSASYDERVLSVSFAPALEPGRPVTLEVAYEVNDPPDGLIWTPESPAWPGRPAQLHTQGQPESNRWWFPSHDFPNERLRTRLEITVPDGYEAVSNGALASRESAAGRTTFVWDQAGDHVNYLVMMAVGKWDIVDVASLDGGQRRVPMPVYAPIGRGADVARTYGRTPAMMDVFERRFGAAYPWEKYAQVVVWNFGAGGMENTSATTMYDTAVLDEKSLRDGDLDGLISHELAHQWFGDLITCNTWAHIWLNEGWATYATALWYEARDGFDGGPGARQNGYLMQMHGSMRGVAAADQIAPNAPEQDRTRPGMVSNIYEHPWETFRRISNPYPKGASILHILRMQLGEEVFFEAVRAYVKRYAHRTVETDQFRRVFEEVSGRSLERFFDQWARRPGTPRVNVEAGWDAGMSELRLVIEQRQHIDADHPAFVFDLPVVVRTKGRRTDLTIPVDSRRHEHRIRLEAEPEMVAVDPMLTVLMDVTVEQPARRFIVQLEEGPTAPSRVDAAAALARNTGNPEAVRALAGAVRNAQEHAAVRAEAAHSLGKLGRADALLEAVRMGEADSKMGAIENARVRLGVIRGLAAANTDEALAALVRVAGSADESYAVRGAALEALGRRGRPQDFPVIVGALGVESRDDTVRQAALRALADLNTKEGLAAAVQFTRPGVSARTRGVAIEVLGRLARHDADTAYAALAPLVGDREERARRSAVAALVEAKEKRGLDDIARAIGLARDPVWRDRLEEAKAQLVAAVNTEKSVDGVNAELERLRRELDLLKQKMKEEIEKK